MVPSLQLLFLGTPVIDLGGKPVSLDTRKAVALLAYLSVAGWPQRRDSLAGLLWPEYPQDRARAALRRTLSSLRRALGAGWLDSDRETIALEASAPITVDVHRFTGLLKEAAGHSHDDADCAECLGRLQEAVALYREDFLTGFTLRDSAPFDDWQVFEGQRLRRRMTEALELLVDQLVGRGELSGALDQARRWLAMDPLQEPVHRKLMQLYAWSGDRSAALLQYRECVRVLDEELGVRPLKETQRLYEAIRQGSGSPESQTATLPGDRTSSSVERLPMVGRGEEWRRLQGLLGGAGQLVVLEGEPGIGKTRLAEEFLSAVRAGGLSVASATAYEDERELAYGPMIDLLRGAARSAPELVPTEALREAARLVPELLPPGGGSVSAEGGPGAQRRFFEGVVTTLEELLDRGGWLVLDDIHWADEATADLLSYLIRRLPSRPVNVLVTWRTEEVPEGHSLRLLLDEAVRRGVVLHLALARLQPGDVARLAEASGVTDGVDLLFQETEGVPFFLVEYLAAVRAGATEPVPGGIRGLLRSRVARVGELGRQLLSVAAVVGRSFDLDTLRMVSGRRDDEVIAALEEVIVKGLVRDVRREEGEPSFDFSHQRLRELVYEDTSLARRRLLHRRAATVLAARSGQASQVAHHYQLAGLDEEASAAHHRAGEEARSVFANQEALAHFQAALALGATEQLALHLSIGDLQTLLGDYGAAQSSYEMAAALASADRLAEVELRLGSLALRRGAWPLAEQHFRSAIELLDGEGGAADAWCDLSLALRGQGDTAEAARAARIALQRSEVEGDPAGVARAENVLGMLARGSGDFEESESRLRVSLARAEEVADPGARVAALNNLALVAADTGRPEEGLDLLEGALVICRQQGDRHREAAIRNNLADLARQTGRVDESMEHLKAAAGIFAEIGAEPGPLEPEIWKLTDW